RPASFDPSRSPPDERDPENPRETAAANHRAGRRTGSWRGALATAPRSQPPSASGDRSLSILRLSGLGCASAEAGRAREESDRGASARHARPLSPPSTRTAANSASAATPATASTGHRGHPNSSLPYLHHQCRNP